MQHPYSLQQAHFPWALLLCSQHTSATILYCILFVNQTFLEMGLNSDHANQGKEFRSFPHSSHWVPTKNEKNPKLHFSLKLQKYTSIKNWLSHNKLLCPKDLQICSYLEIIQSFLHYAQSKIYYTGMLKILKCRSTFFPPWTSVLYFHNAEFHPKVQTFGFSAEPEDTHTVWSLKGQNTQHGKMGLSWSSFGFKGFIPCRRRNADI